MFPSKFLLSSPLFTLAFPVLATTAHIVNSRQSISCSLSNFCCRIHGNEGLPPRKTPLSVKNFDIINILELSPCTRSPDPKGQGKMRISCSGGAGESELRGLFSSGSGGEDLGEELEGIDAVQTAGCSNRKQSFDKALAAIGL